MKLLLAPSCRLVASPYPVLRIWRSNQEGYTGDDRVSLDAANERGKRLAEEVLRRSSQTVTDRGLLKLIPP